MTSSDPHFHSRAFCYFFASYALLRLLSLLTWERPAVHGTIAGAIILVFLIVCLGNLRLGWLLLVSELLLGGSGHFFELFGLLLRTWLLGIFAIVFVVRERRNSASFGLPQALRPLLSIFAVFLVLSSVIGLVRGNGPVQVMQDLALYLFLFLAYPAIRFWDALKKFIPSALAAFIAGSAAFSAATFSIYASGFGILPDRYYHWFRNIAGGKITDLGNDFFRVVLPEHLLLVPAILVLSALLIQKGKRTHWALLFLSTYAVALNFSRIYLLALAGGLLVLFSARIWKWMQVSSAVLLSIVIFIVGSSAVASAGAVLGFELLGIRAGGVSAPASDPSGAIRLAILPNAMRIIAERPFFGSGLGTMVSFVHPATHRVETRTQFDWGYLEMVAELGFFGTAFFLLFLGKLLATAFREARNSEDPVHAAVMRGGCASLVSLAIVNLTTPALFQGFGILCIAALLTAVSNRKSPFPHQTEASA